MSEKCKHNNHSHIFLWMVIIFSSCNAMSDHDHINDLTNKVNRLEQECRRP